MDHDVHGNLFLYGRAGHLRYAIAPLEYVEPGGPTHALIVQETKFTRHGEDPIAAREALAKADGAA